MIRRPPRSTLSSSSAASDVYKRQVSTQSTGTVLTAEMGCQGLLLLLLLLGCCHGRSTVHSNMTTFGVAIKGSKCACHEASSCDEQVLFEHALTPSATHGVITSMWHAGTPGSPQMRVYVDGEVGGSVAAVEYPIPLAHGLAPEDAASFPWEARTFGHSHTTGWYNSYQIPFTQRVRVTMQCSEPGPIYFRVAGAENLPMVIGRLDLPPTSKLHVKTFDQTVGMGGLVTLASIKGAGLVTQLNMFVRSSAAYQEGCAQATVDGTKLWLSSGLEDFFLGAYFHSMPQMELRTVGFHLSNSTTCPSKQDGPNSLAAYRIMHTDPILFSQSLEFQWQPHGNQPELTRAGFPISCNRAWPPSGGLEPAPGAGGDPAVGLVNLTTLTWIYTY
eukprot:TRINITY_DN27557_c0_g1_i3.p1 TRINITY_DN27557_c0_g1~~TRINITY_DN27557_c0_g1_i3.p1  ORF type:complete len:387 (+),score=66.17 TRINITY_DN27557_c0_g1_i3:135-1295(+)